MAEIVFSKPKVVEIPGMEPQNDNGKATAVITKCQLVQGAAAGIAPNAAGGVNPVGVALEAATVAGQVIGFGKDCEVAGFDTTGLAAFDLVYPSDAVAGGMATGADAAVGALPIGRISGDLKRIHIRTM